MVENPAVYLFGVLVLLAAATLIYLYRRDKRRIRSLRADVFVPCYDVFESYRVTQDGINFPILAGRYRGRDFHLEAFVDDLTFRRLPALWLKVSLLSPLPGMPVLDILVRSQNMEFYSPSNELTHAIATPRDWPADALIKTSDPDHLPPIDAIGAPMLAFLALPQAKEILATAKGVRLVYLLDQGRRAEYAVLRQAHFLSPQVGADLARGLMESCLVIHQALSHHLGAMKGQEQ